MTAYLEIVELTDDVVTVSTGTCAQQGCLDDNPTNECLFE